MYNKYLFKSSTCKSIVFNICLRFHSESVRVRFAPSPTGNLHLGGFRTALYNYLFAKSKGGKYILRIEDTDRSRVVNGAIDQLQEDLKWLGIEFDEGPKIGGSFGPYIQSERLSNYKLAAQELLNKGYAYKCYCTEKRLDLLRRDAIRTRRIPRYDNKCRSLDAEEIEQKKNMNFVIRFKLDQDDGHFHDLVYRNVTRNVAAVEGDPVIVKSDGFPTYHLANVVDDHNMQITHVLRGVEWQPSTSKHILLYKAFGWTPPNFAHLPLLMNIDGTKLSKRQNDITISSYRHKGIYPEALLNFVVSCGGGFSDNQTKSKTRIKTLDELISNFDIRLINSNSCQVPWDKLDFFNRAQLKIELGTVHGRKKAVEQLKYTIENAFLKNEAVDLDLSESHLENILLWSVERITNINELVNENFKFIWMKPSESSLQTMNYDKELIMQLKEHLLNMDSFDVDNLGETLHKFSKSNNIIYSKFMKTLRNIISGLKQGPSVSEMMVILGKEDVIARLSRAC
ncbi:probable glutamate--tRNA ligase, mitochondrial [Adelges cooleyi]|uniref:probable glutamate--tRNA ligase, mitochondrial n=1 Tax=Adelges cooleyi TaxID=133065 RepID=UPI00217FD99D|nr:probable glutamate--tRNA ligase, mitochondrial [Adelges cooleyi]